MPHVDLNLTEMRRAILERQHDAMRPFQEELRKLDILEEMMQQNGVQTEVIREWAAPKPTPEGERLQKLYAAETASQAKPNGQAEPKQFSRLKRYAKLTQRQSVIQILTEEPGLHARAITERMIAGGFPFTTTKPYASMTQIMGDMTKDGEVLVEKPLTRVGGQQNRYRVNPGAPAIQRKHMPARALNKAAL